MHAFAGPGTADLFQRAGTFELRTKESRELRCSVLRPAISAEREIVPGLTGFKRARKHLCQARSSNCEFSSAPNYLEGESFPAAINHCLVRVHTTSTKG